MVSGSDLQLQHAVELCHETVFEGRSMSASSNGDSVVVSRAVSLSTSGPYCTQEKNQNPHCKEGFTRVSPREKTVLQSNTHKHTNTHRRTQA